MGLTVGGLNSRTGKTFGMELFDALAHISAKLAREPEERDKAFESLRKTAFPGYPECLDFFRLIHQRLADHDEIRDLQIVHSPGMVTELKRPSVKPRVDIERGTRGIQSLIAYSLYSILPTLIEFCSTLRVKLMQISI